MARSLSWIDPEHLATLIEVVSPAGSRSAGRSDDGESQGGRDGEDPMGLSGLFDRLPEPSRPPQRRPAPQPASQPAPTAAAKAPQPAAQQPAAPAPAPAPAAPATVAAAVAAAPAAAAAAAAAFRPSPDSDLATRLEEFTEWVASSTKLDAVFITDANGLLITERGITRVESALTASIDLLLNHVSDVLQSEVDGYVALQRDGLHLVTLWTPTVYGRFYGVLISKAALHPESLILADQGFRTLFAN